MRDYLNIDRSADLRDAVAIVLWAVALLASLAGPVSVMVVAIIVSVAVLPSKMRVYRPLAIAYWRRRG